LDSADWGSILPQLCTLLCEHDKHYTIESSSGPYTKYMIDVEHIFTRVLKSVQFQLIRVIIPNKN